VFGKDCVVLHHTGPAGNQSPRHVTCANTFDEARRLGEILGRAVEKAVGNISFYDTVTLSARQALLENLPRRTFPSVQQAQKKLDDAANLFSTLKKNNAPKQQVRTAECDVFGAEETLTLAKAAADGRLEQSYQSCLPAEIQVIKIGDWAFVGWQGEIFIEYALEVKRQSPNTFVISLANGEMQGYIVTKEAAAEGGYEASNALFDYSAGDLFVQKTLELLR
jgi:neutral ceramidase